MFDSGKIIAGLVLFGVFVTFPIWWQAIAGKHEPPVLAEAKGTSCVESAEFMRAKHMDLLNQWRDAVVREGQREYTATDGTEHHISLTLTCLDCHDDKAGFCDECHNYAGVQPLCWDCHVDPAEVKP
jgi:hypothetical protein